MLKGDSQKKLKKNYAIYPASARKRTSGFSLLNWISVAPKFSFNAPAFWL